jgi:hypothetical protein
MSNSVISGSEVKVKPEFKRRDNTDELVASVDLLGIVPDSKEGQVLFFKILYKDGSEERTIDFKMDLTFWMQTFNTNKHIPMVLRCNIWEAEGEIIGWEVVEGDSQTIIWPLSLAD